MLSGKKLLAPIGMALLSGTFLMGQGACPSPCTDLDGDGYGSPASTTCTYPELDCHDTDDAVYPGAPEICDGMDNQCPGDVGYGEVDEEHDMMACIPEGCFAMGDAFGEGWWAELPAHNVCISAFEMDVHEVTNAEYAECVVGGGCTVPEYLDSFTRLDYYGDAAYDDFPVIYVDWNKATDYCTWAGKRLPTEAEWEYAARGGLAENRYPWGDTDPQCTTANFYNDGSYCVGDTSEVESYSANGYGLYDMSGNVFEWVSDWFQSDYYSVSPTNDPQGPVSGTFRVLRGGSWYDSTFSLRVADRSFSNPAFDYPTVGIRCAQ